MDAEWELIVLSVLASVGEAEHEPDLGGASRLDVRFKSGSLVFIGDVRTISDEQLQSENPLHLLIAEFERISAKLRREGVLGALDVRVGGAEAAPWKGRYKTKLALPRSHEFRKFVFDWRFNKFLERIRSEPRSIHHYTVDNENASISVVFNPGRTDFSAFLYPPFEVVHDPVQNGIYQALEKKAKQIKRAGKRTRGESAGVFLCDGGCAMLRYYGSVGTSLEQIVGSFLRGNSTVDFVCVLDVRHVDNGDAMLGPLRFEPRVWSRQGPEFDRSLVTLLETGLSRIPPPVMTPINTVNQVARRAAEPASEHHPAYIRGGTMMEGSVEFPLRVVLDYLVGKIDRPTMERYIDPHWLALLRKHLSEGMGVLEVATHRWDNCDDDGLTVRLGGYDASVAPFRVTVHHAGSFPVTYPQVKAE